MTENSNLISRSSTALKKLAKAENTLWDGLSKDTTEFFGV